MDMTDAQSLRQKFEQAGQGHVFAWWDELSDAARLSLLEQLEGIDPEEIARLNATLVQASGDTGVDLTDLEPAPYIPVPEQGGDAQRWLHARTKGEEALRAGRVAAFTVAGGQGTRLGYDGPKGTFGVTPVRGASLFQVFAEKIRAAGERYGKPIHWFIMTSNLNHEATVSFFKQHDFFGLSESHVHFFRQGQMPAVDFDGKIILEGKARLALSPDGHGGSLRALVRSGAVELMRREGIDTLSYFQVDNPLVRPVDPAFIGFHLEAGSEMSSKMLDKAYPKEKVGHFCTQRGNSVVIEYSDMPDDLTEETDVHGNLRFRAGSIAIHVLSRDFIERMGGNDAALALPFHKAKKKIPGIDAKGQPVKPEQPNGIKFEMFVFDALPFAKNPVIIQTLREREFSPVKNAEGVDSPKTCREDQVRKFARWAKAAGLPIATDETGLPAFNFEVVPTFADTQEAFVSRLSTLSPKPVLAEGVVLGG